MKTLKKSPFKTVLNFSFILLFVLNACAQPENKESQANKNTEVKSKVEKPKQDIYSAVLSGNLEVVKQHIEAGTDINFKDQMSGSTPLLTAITFGKTAIAKALIDANADLSLKNNDGATALHVAAFFGRIEIVQMLIDANADKTVRNKYGATARETVIEPFAEMKPIYDMLQQQLEPFGLKLDLDELQKARPVIAMMLQ